MATMESGGFKFDSKAVEKEFSMEIAGAVKSAAENGNRVTQLQSMCSECDCNTPHGKVVTEPVDEVRYVATACQTCSRTTVVEQTS